MEQVGHSLIDANNNEVAFFGDTKGQSLGIPDPLRLPNGDNVHCASVGEQLGAWKLVERWLDANPPSHWYAETGRTSAFDGTKVVVTATYEATPSIVPASVTLMQAKIALYKASLLDQMNAAVAAADPITQIAWQSTHDIDRNHPLMLALAAVLQFSSAEIDNLMRQAALQT